jgi:hypothetical protein
MFSVAFLATGCGTDLSTAHGTPLPAAVWRHRANAICTDVGRKVKAFPQPTSTGEIDDFVAGVAPLWKREWSVLRTLVPPSPMAGTARDLVTALDYVTSSLVEIHVATERDDGARREEAARKTEVAARDFKLHSLELGLQACARQRIP